MKLDLARAGGRRAIPPSWVIVPLALLLAPVLGALLGLQPMLAVPIIGLVLVGGLVVGGAAVARRALPASSGWQPLALLVFWMLVVNIPTFLAFDQTGFTRDHGLFNAQSISRIAVFAFGAVLAFVFWVLWGRDRRAEWKAGAPPGAWPLFALYAWYAVQAPVVAPGLSAALAIFRASEWLVALFLLYLLLQGQNVRGERAFADRLRLMLPMLFLMLGSVLLLLVLRPDAAYQRSSVTGIARLGGPFTHPNLLAIVVTVLFAWALVFRAGWQRLLLCALCLAVLFFTYSRGGYVAFVAVCCIGLLIAVRSAVFKALALGLVVALGLALAQVPTVADEVSRFLSRGNEREGLSTLSERTAVWHAAKIMIARSPVLGEGFIAGPKELGEVMLRYRLSKNFAAPHAHNEFLQAQVSGGVLALLLSLGIHLRVLYLLLKHGQTVGRRASFVSWSIFASVLAWGMLGPSLSYFLSLPGILMAWLLLTFESIARHAAVRQRSAAAPGHHRLADTTARPGDGYGPAGL